MALTKYDFTEIEKIVTTIVGKSEKRIIKRIDDLVKRVDRIESHLGLASIAN